MLETTKALNAYLNPLGRVIFPVGTMLEIRDLSARVLRLSLRVIV